MALADAPSYRADHKADPAKAGNQEGKIIGKPREGRGRREGGSP